MVQIIDGKIVREELTMKARGGTELMAERMVRDIDPELLKEFHIVHSRIRELDPNNRNILVVHDLPNDPELSHLKDPKSRERFKKLVFVSNWQMQMFNSVLGVPYKDSIVMYNAIEPIRMEDKPFDGTVRIIYHTTPHRGLEILVPVFDFLSKQFENIHLDVYSSFSIYGWDERDKQYEELFEFCRNHPKITYHGARPNEEIREALKTAHIYAYPSIWPECHSLATIEALSAKCLVVTPNFGGQPDACGQWAMMYQWNEDIEAHANIFTNVLAAAIMAINRQEESLLARLEHQKLYVDNFFNWHIRAKEWESLLRSLKETG